MNNAKIGVIGGTGIYEIEGFDLAHEVTIEGTGQEVTVVRGTVKGLRTGAVLSGVRITEGRDGGVVVGVSEAPEIRNCAISGNNG